MSIEIPMHVVALRREHPQVPVVLMTAFGSEETAVQALQNGGGMIHVEQFWKDCRIPKLLRRCAAGCLRRRGYAACLPCAG